MARKWVVSYRRIQLLGKQRIGLLGCVVLGLIAAFGVYFLSPAVATQHLSASTSSIANSQARQTVFQQGLNLYKNQRFAEAAKVWESTLQETVGDELQQSLLWNYLALAYQQLERWEDAQRAIATSFQGLDRVPDLETSQQGLAVKARALSTKGRLLFRQGKEEAALETWKQATDTYHRLGDEEGSIGSLINEAQALQGLGRDREALQVLESVKTTLKDRSPNLQAVGFLSLGNALRSIGDLESAYCTLRHGLKVTDNSQLPEASNNLLLSFGNTAQALGHRIREQQDEAIEELVPRNAQDNLLNCQAESTKVVRSKAQEFYGQAIGIYQLLSNNASSPLALKIQAHLSYINLLLAIDPSGYQQQIDQGLQWAQEQIASLPPSRASIYARIQLATHRLKVHQNEMAGDGILELLNIALQHAKSLEDGRSQAYALGYLGKVYENEAEALLRSRRQQEASARLVLAQAYTRQALGLAREMNASDLLYEWQWQTGRILNKQGKKADAIAAYQEAIQTIESFRKPLSAIAFDLKEITPDIQFSFREKVEPIYRQLIELLLQPEATKLEPTLDKIQQARDYLMQLQQAELENFLLCELTAESDRNRLSLDEFIDRKNLQNVAAIYPIFLSETNGNKNSEQIAVILKLPQKELRYYPPQDSTDISTTLNQLRFVVESDLPKSEITKPAQQVYDWLIRPLETDLKNSKIDTLVFVLDSKLRNIPMAALYDGEKYLIQNYGVAINTGLPMADTNPLEKRPLNSLLAALEKPQVVGLDELKFAKQEIDNIKPLLGRYQELINEKFTRSALQKELRKSPYNLLHLVTHGQFSSSPKDTFILTSPGERVMAQELDDLLRDRDPNSINPIELLVLSACETARGDNRAALGLAGVAVRARANSTIATLWNINDGKTARLMEIFYKKLIGDNVSKAEALRFAQRQFLEGNKSEKPREWAPYILVGNWF